MAKIIEHKWALIVLLLICLGVGVVGGWYIIYRIHAAYPYADIPTRAPSVIAFTVIWIIIYTLLAIAAWMIYKEEPSIFRSLALSFFAFQLFLNLLWPILLLSGETPLIAMIDLFTLLVLIGATGVLFWKINPTAGWLFIPYLLWTFYEFELNFEIWITNEDILRKAGYALTFLTQ